MAKERRRVQDDRAGKRTSRAIFASTSSGNAAPTGPVSYSKTMQLYLMMRTVAKYDQSGNWAKPVCFLSGVQHETCPETFWRISAHAMVKDEAGRRGFNHARV
jgi:hypothetical protein